MEPAPAPPMPCARPSRPAGGAASVSTEASGDSPLVRSGLRVADRWTQPPRVTRYQPPHPSPPRVASIAPWRSPRPAPGLRDRGGRAVGHGPAAGVQYLQVHGERGGASRHDGRPHGRAARRLRQRTCPWASKLSRGRARYASVPAHLLAMPPFRSPAPSHTLGTTERRSSHSQSRHLRATRTRP